MSLVISVVCAESVLCQGLQACDAFLEALGRPGLLALALVSHWVSRVVRELISRRLGFVIGGGGGGGG